MFGPLFMNRLPPGAFAIPRPPGAPGPLGSSLGLSWGLVGTCGSCGYLHTWIVEDPTGSLLPPLDSCGLFKTPWGSCAALEA